MSIPTIADFLKAEANAEIEAEALGERSGYAIWPLNPKYPSIKSLYPNAPPGERVVEPGHRPPNHWAIRVRLGRDPRKFTFTCPTKRDAENLGKQFLAQLREYLDDENADMLWNKFVLRAARHVDARLKQICGLDPPSRPIVGPRRADGHEHEWHWTGTVTDARPFPVWHMRCECGYWALLANKVGTESGEWVAFDDAVHDVRNAAGEPIPKCRCGHLMDQHIPLGANECTICDYDRKDPAAPYCLRYRLPDRTPEPAPVLSPFKSGFCDHGYAIGFCPTAGCPHDNSLNTAGQ